MEVIETALIVSGFEKGTAFVSDTLKDFSLERIVTVTSGSEARRLIQGQDFDLVVINAPMKDESGEKLSTFIATQSKSTVILIVKSEHYEEISELVEDYGVITVAKPINKNMFWFSLKLARAAHRRMSQMQKENQKLVQKIEDIRIVDRAKHVLVSYLSMSEQEAHKYIERQAMDSRSTRRAIAEGILKLYENK